MITAHPWFAPRPHGLQWVPVSLEGKLLSLAAAGLLLFVCLRYGRSACTFYVAAVTVVALLIAVLLTTGPG